MCDRTASYKRLWRGRASTAHHHISDGDFTFLLDGRSREEGEPPPPPLAPDSPFESPHRNFPRLRRATPRNLTWLNRRAIANLPSKVSRRCRVFFRPGEPRKRRATKTGTFPPHAACCGGSHKKTKMHRKHGRTFSAWTGHSSGRPITDNESDSHITITKAKQSARQYVNHREMREKKKFLRRGERPSGVQGHKRRFLNCGKHAFHEASSCVGQSGCGLCLFFRSPGPAKAGQTAH